MAGLMGRNLILAFCVAALCLSGCARRADLTGRAGQTGAGLPTPAEVRDIAEDGFLFGLPIVMNYEILYEFAVDTASKQYKAPFNTLYNESRVFTYEDTAVVTPNSDTPYSFIFLDLRAEPMVLSVPAVEKRRYYSLQLVDGNTYNYGYVGSRTTGNAAGDYLVVGPQWQGEIPPGVKKVFRSSTQFSIAIFRTQLFDPADMGKVETVQAGYKVGPLSAHLGQPAPPAPGAPGFPKMEHDLMRAEFFEYLDFALRFAPAKPEEADMRARLARMGVGPGKTFDFAELSPAHKAQALEGMKAGEAKIARRAADIGATVNGWKLASAFGDREFFNGDWLLRAAAAKAGIYGNDAREAVYPMTRTLADGEPLDGGKHRYTLTFAASELPPVNAFWSITMYDGKTQLLVENPLGRYLVNSPMLPRLRKNKDGSLTIFIQKDSPGKNREANWLPAPDGPIYMVMRLYWPKTEAPSVLPVGSGAWRPPAVMLSR